MDSNGYPLAGYIHLEASNLAQMSREVMPFLLGVSFGSPSLSKNTLRRVDMSRTFLGGIPMYSIMICIYSSSDSPGNMGYPVINSNRIVPRDHISIAELYEIPSIISGAR